LRIEDILKKTGSTIKKGGDFQYLLRRYA